MAFEPSLEPLLDKTKSSQLDFMNIELELCAMWIRVALDARKEEEIERFANAKANAVKASEAVGRLIHHIEEGRRASIIERLSDLDLVIDGL
jgi:hypothetical protein